MVNPLDKLQEAIIFNLKKIDYDKKHWILIEWN